MFSSTRRSYKPHAQPRVEPNSHNTLLRVKRSGSEIPGQVYNYRTSQEGAVPGQELDRWREGTLYGPSGKCPRNLPRSVRFESPHTPRHPRATDRRERQIGRPENFTVSRRRNFERSTTGPDIAPSSKTNARRKSETTNIGNQQRL